MKERELEFGVEFIGVAMPPPEHVGFRRQWEIVGRVMEELRKRNCNAVISQSPKLFSVSVLRGRTWFNAQHANPAVAVIRCAFRAFKGRASREGEEGGSGE